MPREALIGMTLMMTLAVLGAGREPTVSPPAVSGPVVDAQELDLDVPATAVVPAAFTLDIDELVAGLPQGLNVVASADDQLWSLTVSLEHTAADARAKDLP